MTDFTDEAKSQVLKAQHSSLSQAVLIQGWWCVCPLSGYYTTVSSAPSHRWLQGRQNSQLQPDKVPVSVVHAPNHNIPVHSFVCMGSGMEKKKQIVRENRWCWSKLDLSNKHGVNRKMHVNVEWNTEMRKHADKCRQIHLYFLKN